MLRGLWRLTWLEIKIFLREPLGVLGTVGIPVLAFAVMARLVGSVSPQSRRSMPAFATSDLPVFASLLIIISAVLSLVTIVAIYREGGILKRYRATPLRPYTILTAHVLVKLLLTALTFAAMMAAGQRQYQAALDARTMAFAGAMLFSTLGILSIGFIVASMVPTARFAQPIATLILYPMLGISGLFVPVESLPQGLQMVARVLPLTYTVSLLRGVWNGDALSAHISDIAILAVMFVLCAGLSAKVFRWE